MRGEKHFFLQHKLNLKSQRRETRADDKGPSPENNNHTKTPFDNHIADRNVSLFVDGRCELSKYPQSLRSSASTFVFKLSSSAVDVDRGFE